MAAPIFLEEIDHFQARSQRTDQTLLHWNKIREELFPLFASYMNGLENMLEKFSLGEQLHLFIQNSFPDSTVATFSQGDKQIKIRADPGFRQVENISL